MRIVTFRHFHRGQNLKQKTVLSVSYLLKIWFSKFQLKIKLKIAKKTPKKTHRRKHTFDFVYCLLPVCRLTKMISMLEHLISSRRRYQWQSTNRNRRFIVMCGNIHIDKCVFKTQEFQILYWTLLFANTNQQICIFYADILMSMLTGGK